MFNYVENDLNENEWVVQKAERHWAYLLPEMLLCICFIGFILLPIRFLKLRSTELAFTNKRLLGKKGVFNIEEVDIPLEQVSDIKIMRTLVSKMFGFGTIVIRMGGRNVRFDAIRNPEKFKKDLREQAQRHREALYYAQMTMQSPWQYQQYPTPVYQNWNYPQQQYYY